MWIDTFQQKIIDRLLEIRPGAEWSLDGDTYEGLIWLDKVQIKPTKEEIGLWEPNPK